MRPTPDWDPLWRDQLLTSLQARPPIPWHVPVDEHYDAWVGHFQQSWQAVTQQAQQVPRRPQRQYLSTDTLTLVDARNAYRQYVHTETQELRRRRLLVVFAALFLNARDEVFDARQLDVILYWFWQMHVSIAQAVLFLLRTGPRVRKAVRQDRVQYLVEVKDRIAQQDLRNPKELFKALRKAFPVARNSRKSSFKPLPQLLDASGEYASSQEERMQRWRTYFAEQESGFPVTDVQYVHELGQQKRLLRHALPVFEWAAIPTLREADALLHQQRSMKASGNDGITAELLKLSVPTTARGFLPILAKTTLRLHEPSAFRGGSLMTLAKRAAAACDCAHFRSILLACTPGKVYHRYLRQQLIPLLDSTRPDMQAGAVPNIGIEALAITARLFQELSQRMRSHWGFVLFDIRAAFYRVVRQMVAEVPETDEHICRLVRSLGLPDSALSELHAKLRSLSEIAQAGATPHVHALVTDVLQGTFFRMDSDHLTQMTKRGTRPGDFFGGCSLRISVVGTHQGD